MRIEVYKGDGFEKHPDFWIYEDDTNSDPQMLLNELVVAVGFYINDKDTIPDKLANRIRSVVSVLKEQKPGALQEAVDGWSEKMRPSLISSLTAIGIKI